MRGDLLTSSGKPGPDAMPRDKDNVGRSLSDAVFLVYAERVTTNYVKLEDINRKAVPEIKLVLCILTIWKVLSSRKQGIGYFVVDLCILKSRDLNV